MRSEIEKACAESNRSENEVCLLAVSKTRSVEEISELAHLGQRAFGENYLQEAQDKISALEPLNLEWHFIGPIQSNKTKPIAEQFSIPF